MNKDLLRAKLRQKRMTQAVVAKGIGMSAQSFSNKLNERNNKEFTLGEMMKIKKHLDIGEEELINIFFNDKVSSEDTKEGEQ